MIRARDKGKLAASVGIGVVSLLLTRKNGQSATRGSGGTGIELSYIPSARLTKRDRGRAGVSNMRGRLKVR